MASRARALLFARMVAKQSFFLRKRLVLLCAQPEHRERHESIMTDREGGNEGGKARHELHDDHVWCYCTCKPSTDNVTPNLCESERAQRSSPMQ